MSITMTRLARLFVAAAIALISITAFATAPSKADTGAFPVAALCPVEHVDAKLTEALAPEYPEIAREQDAKGTAYVQVDLLSSGEIANVSIALSSGNRYLDIAAMNAARQARFDPEIRNCASVGGTYLLAVDFE